MADLFDLKVEEELAKLGAVKEELKKACPYGHPLFIDMVLRATILHSMKNKDYAGGGAPLGNFTRRSAKAGVYKTGVVNGVDLSDTVQLMMWDIEKQLDAAWWMRVKRNKAAVEGVSKRLWDVAVYALITMCQLSDEETQAAATEKAMKAVAEKMQY